MNSRINYVNTDIHKHQMKLPTFSYCFNVVVLQVWWLFFVFLLSFFLPHMTKLAGVAWPGRAAQATSHWQIRCPDKACRSRQADGRPADRLNELNPGQVHIHARKKPWKEHSSNMHVLHLCYALLLWKDTHITYMYLFFLNR